MKDFQLLLNRLKSAHKQKLPFVAYRKPDQKYVKAMVQQDDTLYFATNMKEPGFVFAPFNSKEKTILIPFSDATILEAPYEEASVSYESKYLDRGSTKDKAQHVHHVNKAIRFIEKGQADKIVVSRKETIEYSDFSFDQTFTKMLAMYANAFVYVWYHPAIGLWLGATPERLVVIKGSSFQTVSLAGTQPYINTVDVNWGSKERKEQQLVTDFIKLQLSTLAESFSISHVDTIKAGNLLHLRTEIKGIVKSEKDVSLLIQNLHPTPAVCGLPREEAKRFILDNEGYDREFYTGFLGEMAIDDTTNLYVNLRCMKYEDPHVALFLGGGITKESMAESEWNETVEKSKVIKSVL